MDTEKQETVFCDVSVIKVGSKLRWLCFTSLQIGISIYSFNLVILASQRWPRSIVSETETGDSRLAEVTSYLKIPATRKN